MLRMKHKNIFLGTILTIFILMMGAPLAFAQTAAEVQCVRSEYSDLKQLKNADGTYFYQFTHPTLGVMYLYGGNPHRYVLDKDKSMRGNWACDPSMQFAPFSYTPDSTTASTTTGGQCSNGIDDDGDNLIDTNGKFVPTAFGMRQVTGADPQCTVAGAICENGLKTSNCKAATTSTQVTTTTTNDSNADVPGVKDSGGPDVPGVKCTPPCNSDSQFTDVPLRIKLKNPLAGTASTVPEVIRAFMNAVMKVAIPFIVVFFIWAGLRFILAQGNKDKIAEAKKMFWYTIIGSLLILGAWGITNAIVGTINSLTS